MAGKVSRGITGSYELNLTIGVYSSIGQTKSLLVNKSNLKVYDGSKLRTKFDMAEMCSNIVLYICLGTDLFPEKIASHKLHYVN